VVALFRSRWGARARLEREGALVVDTLAMRLAEITAGRAGSTATVARLPITIAARALIADVPAALPLAAVRDGAPITPTPTLLVRPDPHPSTSRRRWVHRAMMSLTGWGNLYVRVVRMGADGWALAAEVIPPDYVAPVPDPLVPWRAAGWTVAGQPTPPGDLVHVPLWETDLGITARSPLAEAQQAFDDLALLWGFATAYWGEGGKPPYVLKYPTRMDGAKARQALDQWVAARLEHRPGLLTGGWDIADLSMPNAADALLLDGLAYIDQAVGRIYGLTPTLLNIRAETGSLTYTNARDEVTRWYDLSLYPTWLARVEDAFTQLLPRGQQAVFDTSALGVARAGLDEARPTGALPGPVPPALDTPPPPPPPPPPAFASSSPNGGGPDAP
jgi:phage portal protein BeeE